MGVRNYSNIAPETQLTVGIDPTQSTFTVQSLTGYPAVPFSARIDKATALEEVVLVTAKSGNTVTVTRGYDGTSAQSHVLGARFEHPAIAQDYAEANAHVNATSGVHGTTGELVDEETPQEVSNKTLLGAVGEATPASPAIRLDTTSADQDLIVGRLGGATVMRVSKDGDGTFPRLGLGPGVSIDSDVLLEVNSADTKVPVRTVAPSTTPGLEVTASGGGPKTSVFPNRVRTTSGGAESTLDPGALVATGTDAAVKVLDLKSGGSGAEVFARLRNAANAVILQLLQNGDLALLGNLSAKDATLEDVVATTVDADTITVGASNTNVETRMNAIDADVTALETRSARGVGVANADIDGIVSFAHGLGIVPTWWGATPANQPTEALNQFIRIIAWTADATMIRFRCYRSDNGAALANNTNLKIHWEAYK